MEPFVYTASAARVVFGSGTKAILGDEIRRLSCHRAVVLSTPHQRSDAEALAAQVGSIAVGVFADAAMHTPIEVTEAAVARITELHADCVVALGGGSAVGLGKAIALNTDLPQIVLPTTYAGSETTSILGQTAGGEKTTLRSLKVLPEVIIYDVDFTMSLPAHQTAVSGMNAIAHAVEALYAADRNPITSVLAEEGIRSLVRSLPKLVVAPGDRQARADALYGAWLCGNCLNAVSMGLHHKLCHTLGGMFELPHAETHTVILPHATSYNSPAAPEAMARVARIFDAEDAGQGLFDFVERIGAPTSLAALGMKERDIERAALSAVKIPYPNPRLLTLPSIRALLNDAFHGARPLGTTSKAGSNARF
jgi:maleylacetate reductase